ncbi:MAG: OadG family protein [bacterium]|jgi:sodium pump decarboxylase gamma subunit|nr:OadG family protein [Bacillota bacterium]HHW55339.1 OadG family protein [Bacillota bacterium]
MENIMLGFRLTIIGMGITFISLYLLSVIVGLLSRICGRENKGTVQEESVEHRKPEPMQTMEEPVQGAETKDQIPAELVAVIAGALAAYLDAEPAGVRLRVVRRQFPFPFSAWSMAGRQELMGCGLAGKLRGKKKDGGNSNSNYRRAWSRG